MHQAELVTVSHEGERTKSGGGSLILWFLVILLVLSNAYQYYINYSYQQFTTVANENFGIFISHNRTTDGVLDALKVDLYTAGVDLDTLFRSVNSLQRDINYVESLAENANNYAHDHPYSDSRLKQNIKPLSNQLESVMKLRPVEYEWNHDVAPTLQLGEQSEMGLIAQEVELLYPDVVATGSDGYKTVDYEQLIPVLIQAIQEQQVQIEQLEAQIAP